MAMKQEIAGIIEDLRATAVSAENYTRSITDARQSCCGKTEKDLVDPLRATAIAVRRLADAMDQWRKGIEV